MAALQGDGGRDDVLLAPGTVRGPDTGERAEPGATKRDTARCQGGSRDGEGRQCPRPSLLPSPPDRLHALERRKQSLHYLTCLRAATHTLHADRKAQRVVLLLRTYRGRCHSPTDRDRVVALRLHVLSCRRVDNVLQSLTVAN